MILGCSHLCWGSRDLPGDLHVLDAAGFKVQFQERSLANDSRKASFLNEPAAHMGMALCRSVQGGVAVELVKYPRLFGRSSADFDVVLGACGLQAPMAEDCADVASVVRGALDVVNVSRHVWGSGAAGVWSVAGAPARVLALLKPVAGLEDAVRFWSEALGWKATRSGGAPGFRWQRMDFRSPVPAWSLPLVLHERSGAAEPSRLDEAGGNCLSVLVRDVERTRQRLLEWSSVTATEIMELTVNAQPLKLAMVRVPDGALLELLEAPARRLS